MLFRIIWGVILSLQMMVAQAAGLNQSTWDALLKKHVITLQGGQVTQVNYAGMQQDKSRLGTYLQSTSAVSRSEFERWNKNEQLAFLINNYNAWTVSLILSEYPNVKSIKDLGSFFQSPWKKSFIPLLGETRSLDDIEHTLIRGSGRYNDPRVHFAVNCASIGCPALRSEAYQAERLDSQLDEATRLFLADRNRNRVVGQSLQVSSIFKWYREDFEKGWRGFYSLNDFFVFYYQALDVNHGNIQKLKKMNIEFLDYDWRLNKKS